VAVERACFDEITRYQAEPASVEPTSSHAARIRLRFGPARAITSRSGSASTPVNFVPIANPAARPARTYSRRA
jgi:hypothetical protein